MTSQLFQLDNSLIYVDVCVFVDFSANGGDCSEWLACGEKVAVQ